MTFPFPLVGDFETVKDLAFVASSSGTLSGTSTSSINIPGPPKPDDIVIVALTSDTGSVTAPTDGVSDYSLIVSFDGNSPDSGAYYKIMGSTPDTTVDITGWHSGTPTAYIILVFEGVDTGSPLDVTPTFATGSGSQPDPPSITTATDGAGVLSFGFIDDNDITSCTQSGGSDLIFQAGGGGGSSTSSGMFAWQLAGTAGSVNPSAFVTDGSDSWFASTVALRQAT